MTGIVNGIGKEPTSDRYMGHDHLKLFETLVEKWAVYFGVSHRWELYVSWGDDPSETAGVHYKIAGRIATVVLTNPYRDTRGLSAEELSRAACHEVAHILLAPMSDLAEDGALRGMNINDIEHEIVHTLVKNARAHCELEILECCTHLISQAFPPPEPIDDFAYLS